MKIAIVGVGPRGLLIFNNLVRKFPKSEYHSLTIDLIDRYPAGGRVWQTNQDHILKMDTASQQITMFSKSVQPGPNLYQWLKTDGEEYLRQQKFPAKARVLRIVTHEGPNDYFPRCVFGFYLRWFFATVMHHLPKKVHVKFFHHYLLSIRRRTPGYRLVLEDSEKLTADQVVLNLGQKVNTPTHQEMRFMFYARNHRLNYFPVGYVEEHDFSSVRPRRNMIVRGLGLNFADSLNVLTRGRGGTYVKRGGKVVYQASGREPLLIAGSRSGVPYYCKTYNQVRNGHHHQPYFISGNSVRKHLKSGRISFRRFFHLVELDIELVYYTHLLRRKFSRVTAEHFAQRFKTATDPERILSAYHLQPAEYFSLRRIVHPIDLQKVQTLADYRSALIKWMDRDIADAARGNVGSALTAAFEVFRNGRNDVRSIISHHDLTPDDYVKRFLPFFNHVNSFLSMGAPLTDMRKMRALLKAGVLTIIPGTMWVVTRNCQFVCGSKQFPRIKFAARTMIEARNPVPKLSRMIDPLTSDLIQSGILSRPSLKLAGGQTVNLDTTNVDPNTDEMIDSNGKVEKGLFTWGLSTEGVHWCTPTAPHTSGHDANLAAGIKIADQLLKLPVKHPVRLLQ